MVTLPADLLEALAADAVEWVADPVVAPDDVAGISVTLSVDMAVDGHLTVTAFVAVTALHTHAGADDLSISPLAVRLGSDRLGDEQAAAVCKAAQGVLADAAAQRILVRRCVGDVALAVPLATAWDMSDLEAAVADTQDEAALMELCQEQGWQLLSTGADA